MLSPRQTTPTTIQTTLRGGTTVNLRNVGLRHSASLFTVILTVWEVFVSFLTGFDDFVVGVPFAGRSQPEFNNIAGYLVNVLPHRAQFGNASTLEALLARVKETFIAAVDNADVPFAEVVEAHYLQMVVI